MNNSAKAIELESGWRAHLEDVLVSSELQQLKQYLMQRHEAGVTIYPEPKNWFAAFNLTPYDQVRVVILGQDPYHGPGQAHGLSFSVPYGVRTPPSLQNIFLELHKDCNLPRPTHGNLTHWAQQGVLLLNTSLTVERGAAAAHRDKGWEQVTGAAIRALNSGHPHLVFMLWGSHARAFAPELDADKHLILQAPHPSPMSAHRGFLGCKHFSLANAWLKSHRMAVVDWSLPEAAEVERA